MKRIILEKSKCIGCGTCSAVCPSHWEMGEDGLASLKGGTEKENVIEKEVEEAGCNEEAAQLCAAQCIKIENNKEKENN